MVHPLRRLLGMLDLEERILNAASLLAVVSIFFPWISGEWLGGDTAYYTGFAFFTSFIGWFVLLLHGFLLLSTFVPLLGGPLLIRRKHLHIVRFLLASQATVLTIATLTVLTNITFEFSRMEVRFGVYLSLIGSMVATLYAFLKWQEQRKREAQELFHHPEQKAPQLEPKETRAVPPPPPPPRPLSPEEHHLHGR